MKKVGNVFLSIFITFSLLVMPLLANISIVFANSKTEVTIIHTNDMHGSVADLAYVKTMRDIIPNAILVDAGDAAQGSALATFTEGIGIIELMNFAGYDGMVLGNHEFDYGTEATLEMARVADFPVVSANSLDKNGNILLEGINGNNGQYFIKEVDGIQVGFFGITTTETSYKTNPSKLDGVTFGDEIEYTKEQVAILQAKGADVIVGLVHVGIDATSDPTSHEIARQVDGIDVLIDGHSHSQDQSTINGTRIVQAGTKLAAVGVVNISIDNTSRDIHNITSRLIINDPINNPELSNTYEADANYLAYYQAKNEALAPILKQKVSYADTTVFTFDRVGNTNITQVSRLEETPGGNLVADAMLYEASKMLPSLGYHYPIVSLQNGGGVRANIHAGDVTVEDVLDVLPFGNMISIKEITPNMLYQALETGYASMVLTDDGLINTSYTSGGFAQIGGMRVVLDANQLVGSRVKEIYLLNDNGHETLLDSSDSTTKIAIVSNDYIISGGDQYDALKNLNHIVEAGTLETVLQNYIKDFSDNGVFTYAHTSGRITVQQIEEIQDTGYLNIIPDITFIPYTTYDVTIDGIKTIKVTTNEDGNFVLEQVTNGVHTISVEGNDYYVSSYTNIGLLDFEVTFAPNEVITPTPDEPGQIPSEIIPNPIPVNSPQTGDTTAILGTIFSATISGLYLALHKKQV